MCKHDLDKIANYGYIHVCLATDPLEDKSFPNQFVVQKAITPKFVYKVHKKDIINKKNTNIHNSMKTLLQLMKKN